MVDLTLGLEIMRMTMKKMPNLKEIGVLSSLNRKDVTDQNQRVQREPLNRQRLGSGEEKRNGDVN